MPSDKILKQKQEQVESLTNDLKNALAGVIVDYKGINVGNDTKLRKELREAGVSYRVVKNSLLRRASENVGYDGLKDVLVETTALAISDTDYTAAAKILCKYADASKGKFTIKAGFVEGVVLDAKGVKNLSELPSREELVAMTLRGLNAPISGLANVLNANIRGLAVALNQIAEQKEQSA
ncbi:MAG: 50S ribosomal protein L10 [Oscillospiraceae bacterium]|nr:50S ribosomal protein L10 [Oscillospiraceae bacterium]